MEKVKFSACMLAVFLVMGAASITYSATTIQIVSFHAVDSPVEITQIQSLTAPNEYQITLYNKFDKDIYRIVLKGNVYNAKDEFIGGFMNRIEVNLRAGETRAIKLNLKEILSAQDEAGAESLKNFLQDANVIILIPNRVYYKTSSAQEPDKEESYYWLIDYHILQKLTPGNLFSFQKVKGKIIKDNENIIPRLPCYYCEWCSQEAWGCGIIYLGGNCSSFACTSHYSCNCTTGACSYTCRPLVQCC